MVYFFIHTTKTSGTTFMDVLRRDAKNKVAFFYPIDREMDNFERRIKEAPYHHLEHNPDWEKYDYIGGHFTFGIHDIFKAKDFRYIGVIREPLSHYISFYKAFLRMPEAYKETVMPKDKQSIEEMLKLEYTHNIQTFFLSGLSQQEIREDKERAYRISVENVEKYFAGVYPTQHFDEGLFFFKHKIGLRPQFYKKKNVASNPIAQQLSAQTIDRIKAANDVDAKLYDYLYQRFFDEYQKMPFINLEVKAFGWLNSIYGLMK